MIDLPLVVRTFIAIDVPDELKQTIGRIQRSLMGLGEGKITWPRLEGIHLTLKFLGDVDRDELPKVTEAVETAVKGVESFSLKTTVKGAFPRLQQPRVLWLGVDGGNTLIDLYNALQVSLFDAGFPIDEGQFHPHLTVGRVKILDRGAILPLKFIDLPLKEFCWNVSCVNVMASQLHPSGAVYRVASSVPLPGVK